MTGEIGITAVDHVFAPDIGHAGIEFAGEQHRSDALFGRNVVDGDAGRRLEADCAGMAALRQTFHEESHLRRRDAELVFENAAGPQRRSLYVFRYADALAFEPGGTVDACILTHQDAGMV